MPLENLNVQFREYISNQSGISIVKETDSYINFSSNGLIFVFEIFENDPYYFRIILPNIFAIDNSNESWVNTQIENFLINIKVARLVKKDLSVSAIADSFVYSPKNIDYLFNRVLSCLVTVYDEFKKNYFDEYGSQNQ